MGRRREPLLHAILALAISAASLLLAWWTLWPSPARPHLERGVVLAAPPGAPASSPASAPGFRRATPGEEPPRATSTPAAGPSAPERGFVIDGWGRPAPGAEIWVEDGEWRLATHADALGAFRLELPGSRVGARHAGHAPSLVHDLEEDGDGPLRLVLGGAPAGLSLEVVDEIGQPLPGVGLRLEPPLGPGGGHLRVLDALGRLRELTPAPPDQTDRTGRARLEGLAAGRRLLRVELPGHAPRLEELVLREGERTHRRVVLPRSASASGLVRTPDGLPARAALVEATCLESWRRLTARTNGDGSYRLEGLPAARVRLEATLRGDDGVVLHARIERELLPGERADWSPTLERTQGLAGQLLDADGQPLGGWTVEQRAGEGPGEQRRRVRTDAEGQFLLPASAGLPGSRLDVFHPLARHGVPSRTVEGPADRVRLAEDELRVGVLSGRVVHAGGQPAGNALLRLRRLSDGATLGLRLGADGSFSTPPLPVGAYAAEFPHHGRGWCPDGAWVVDGHGPRDLGLVVLPATGALALTTSAASRAAETTGLRIELLRPGLAPGERLVVLAGAIEAPLTLQLAPGRYLVSLSDRPEVEPREVQVDGGVTTTLPLPD